MTLRYSVKMTRNTATNASCARRGGGLRRARMISKGRRRTLGGGSARIVHSRRILRERQNRRFPPADRVVESLPPPAMPVRAEAWRASILEPRHRVRRFAVRPQRDDSVKGSRYQFRLQNLHFRLLRVGPKLPVQILTRARNRCIVYEAGGIADRVEREAVSRCQLRLDSSSLINSTNASAPSGSSRTRPQTDQSGSGVSTLGPMKMYRGNSKTSPPDSKRAPRLAIKLVEWRRVVPAVLGNQPVTAMASRVANLHWRSVWTAGSAIPAIQEGALLRFFWGVFPFVVPTQVCTPSCLSMFFMN